MTLNQIKEVFLGQLQVDQHYFVWGIELDTTRPDRVSELKCDLGTVGLDYAPDKYLEVGGHRYDWDWLERNRYIRFFGPVGMPTLAELEKT